MSEAMNPEQHAATIRDTDSLKAVVRYALQIHDPMPSTTQAGLVALDALAALAQEAKDAWNEWHEVAEMRLAHAEAAEERASQLEHERDEALGLLNDVRTECRALIEQRHEARREADQLRRDKQVLVMRNSALQDKLLGLDTSPAALAGLQAEEQTDA